ncbi:MAG: bifunctional diaminohydroxyphosphoribosylaminopyrimidine deaminase/5-amino-6-(5-phosphoribosylamino)uracil reductase RibD [Spirochaetales bacterium]|nr:bifunctional diaminohydroxyphosphoribosylaminopyrimidine deaminase/5-amino-6-(5-phosphoribosylamino)uracil reductase RibD [Spirochaetales bacterium]
MNGELKVDKRFMKMALKLGEKGKGKTSPNPMVGAVIVKNGRIIGRGYHKKAGQPHAEVNAFNSVKESAAGATLYVNLEPCCHFGKTPPCTDRIIEERIGRVVIGMEDPNGLVKGKGIAVLKKAGIEVTVPVMEEEARELNRFYLKHITAGIPFVTLKSAVTLDGKIATRTGQSRWITGEAAREYVHYLRSLHDGILAGVNTVIADDPELTARQKGKRKKRPVRIVLDSSGRTPLSATVLKGRDAGRTIIATTSNMDEELVKKYMARGTEVLIFSSQDGRVNLKELLQELGNRGLFSLFVEGGSEVTGSFLDQGLFDSLCLFLAPKILGGKQGLSFAGGREKDSLEESVLLELKEMKRFEDDVMLLYNRRKKG